MRRFKRIFAAGSGLSEFSARMRHLFVINILWVVCSIPIITYGAATAAAYDALQYTDRAESLKSGKLYFFALRKNFKRASFLWLELVCIGVPICVGIYFLARSGSRNFALLAAAFFFLFLYAVLFVYAFPVCIRSDGSAMEVIVFSLMGGLRHLPWTVLMVLLAAIPVVMFFFATYWFAYTGLLWLIYGFAFIAYVNQLIARRVFRKLSRCTDFLLPPPEDIPVEATSGI